MSNLVKKSWTVSNGQYLLTFLLLISFDYLPWLIEPQPPSTRLNCRIWKFSILERILRMS